MVLMDSMAGFNGQHGWSFQFGRGPEAGFGFSVKTPGGTPCASK
jgi:hypothetical protein